MALSAAKAKKILEDGFIRGKALTEKQKKFFGAIAGGATPLKKLNGGWLDKFQNGGDVSFDSVQRAIRNVESLDGNLMWNPESTATGLYGQLFSQVKDDYSGTRKEFAQDTIAQKKFFKDRFFEGLPSTQTTSLVQDANDIYNEYAPQISNFNYSKEDLAVLSNFLGRQGTREYLGYHVRDNQPLEKALPNIYGSDAKQRNKTPEQYLKQARKYYKEGGWLEKFDNGGVQPNYNDSNVSLPPGFKGWGYDKGGRAYNGAWDGPVAQDGQRVADIATRWEMNEIDSGRPPLNIVEKVKSWFDPDSCVRDNTCVQTVKDIQSEAGIYAIPDDVYNNREFLKNYKKYGFTQITDEKDLQPGDILQYYSRDEKEAEKDPNYVDFPYHMGIYVNPGEYIGDGDSKAPTQRKNMYYEYDSKGNRYDKDPFRIFRYTPPKKQMGGSLSGATGMMYARTSGTSPEEPKKAQDGGAMVSQYEEPAWYEKVLDYAASPMTTLGYLARGEDLPDRLPINVPGRSEYDNWNFDMINPAAWIKYGASARRNFEKGEYLDSAFDALSAIPIVPAWLSKGKKAKAAIKKGKDIETAPLRELFTQPDIYPTSSPLPKNMEPYLSKRVYPFNKEQEIFESFLPIDAQIKNVDLKSIRYDADGNIIPNMEYGGEIDKAQWGKLLKTARNLYKRLQRIDNSTGNNIEYVYKNKKGEDVAKFSGVRKGDAIEVKGIQVSEPYRRQGVAQNIYEEVGKESPLMSRSSQQQFTSRDESGRAIAPANLLWEKLVQEGKAEKLKQGVDYLYKTKLQEGGVIEDDRGQWAYPGEITKINSNNITMTGVNYPVLGISDTGDTKMMQPGKDYKFKGNSVTEFPMARDGKSLVELNQLTNFTNYNTPQPGGWLDKY